MERKEFLKKLGMSNLVLPFATACEDDEPTDSSCTATESETEGPFPTKNPAALEMMDIRSGGTGVALLIEITTRDKNNNCSPPQDTIVEIWHRDKDGYYSEYGGTNMQTIDYAGVHFLRGRQFTDGNVHFNFSQLV